MKVEEIYERLKKVKEPITEVDVVSLGLVEKVIADEDGVRVYLRLSEGLRHPFQHALSWPVKWRIVRDIVAALDDVVPLEILDSKTLERYYPLEED
ncbi:hypothetical protein X802_01675 [Thermococcus guaymasensis DSM 11113]|uniref:MIP18 family-like domain-containing protein n=1 Tax=Thermococcus guaymasensis DSM 11113 TaxID=1432656 RepID=A0A0X1KIE8_9EURY|nr:iron-sulfur cluster assembly protein [Thermococcus guaymasensis]AJC71039.1 hypothetical protein X802_01675 [Thermococcus guaymasensis DSM 11113]